MSDSQNNKKTRHNTRTNSRTSRTNPIYVGSQSQHSGTKSSKSVRIRPAWRPKTLRIFHEDLDEKTYLRLVSQDILQIDTETSGLDFRHDSLHLVQIGTKNREVYLIHHPNPNSYFLIALLTHVFASKYFHHALFDMRFIKSWLGIDIKGEIYCTKTLLKIIYPEQSSGLASNIRDILNIDFTQTKINHNDWNNDKLSENQQAYAAEDVLYLYALSKQLEKNAKWGQLTKYHTARNMFKELVSLQVEGYEDLFQYENDSAAIQHRQEWAIKWERLPNLTRALAQGRIC